MCYKDIPSHVILLDILRKTISTAWNIGNKIHQPSINNWLNNFTGEALCTKDLVQSEAEKLEKQLALFLLCNFVYYNENEIKHLTRVMFDNYIHKVFSLQGVETVNDDNINTLLAKTQFTLLGRISESSSYLLYHFRQENDLSKENFARKKATENIVLVDDFSITGSQAAGYIDSHKNDNLKDTTSKKIFVLLMIATKDAIIELEKIKDITVLPCIVLDNKSKAFSDESIVFDGYDPKIKKQAKKMCEYYGGKIVTLDHDMTALGFGGGEYMFGSYYNIPDNTLPIFWASENNWNYLFKRYNKKYSGGISYGGRYV
jgi:hypothetical protein